MSEKQTVETKKIGFSFSVSIEKELRTETGAKYPDKTLIKGSIEGNADTYDEAVALMKKAKTELMNLKPEETPKESETVAT
jgi:hypothetical protein